MSRMKNIMQKCEEMTGKINPYYDISIKDVVIICNGSDGRFDICTNAFKLGYMQGMKAAKAEMQKGGMA